MSTKVVGLCAVEDHDGCRRLTISSVDNDVHQIHCQYNAAQML